MRACTHHCGTFVCIVCAAQMFALLQEGNPKITLWDSTSRKTQRIDTNMKDPTFLQWSKLGPQLAIGTAKGNLLLYNKDSRKTTPVLGKHPKKISCGSWSSTSNVLAMGSIDSVLSIRCVCVCVSHALWLAISSFLCFSAPLCMCA